MAKSERSSLLGASSCSLSPLSLPLPLPFPPMAHSALVFKMCPVACKASSRKYASTGNVRPGTVIPGAPPKYRPNKSLSIVADIKITFRSLRRRQRERRASNRKSLSTPRSWTSSTTTCVVPSRSVSASKRRNRMPVVQKSKQVSGPVLLSSLTEYPIDSPSCSPRSSATRSATLMALILRGCVHTTEQGTPDSAAFSTMYCPTCVVLPQPVSPSTIVTWWPSIASRISVRCSSTGRASRTSCSDGFPGAWLGTKARRFLTGRAETSPEELACASAKL
mmetsp:Transcript_23573/g.42891  ORF Transcript_23573/g.42891 Transcript_23573/m.42891 type:complete len:278 (+) Transcript_23573:2176-3009(+)